MTKRELNAFKSEFAKFLCDSVKKYQPDDAEIGLMYTRIIEYLNKDMINWYIEEKEQEDN